MSARHAATLPGEELAHVLRNPLSSVKLALQSLGRETPGPRTRLALREVRKLERLLCALAEWDRPAHPPGGRFSLAVLLEAAASDVGEELCRREVEWAPGAGMAALPEVTGAPLLLRPLLAQLLAEVAERSPGVPLSPELRLVASGLELRLVAPGLANSGAARLCLVALHALLQPAGGAARAEGPDLLRLHVPT